MVLKSSFRQLLHKHFLEHVCCFNHNALAHACFGLTRRNASVEGANPMVFAVPEHRDPQKQKSVLTGAGAQVQQTL